MNIHEQLGNILMKNLEDVRQKKGAINMADIGSVLENISREMGKHSGSGNKNLLDEVKQLAEFLEKTKQEVMHDHTAADATLHLAAIIQNTEEASHKIIDAVGAISEVANDIGGEAQKAIAAEITKIYEACNFQDLTSQRITKVIKILDSVSERINNMLMLFGTTSVTATKPEGEAALLNGPQLPDRAPTQSDIDALFSSF